jgi:HK97 family phage prohead protease
MQTIHRRVMPVGTMTNRTIEGIAVPYRSLSCVLRDKPRPYRERMEPRAMQIDDSVSMFIQHEPNAVPLARTGAGTLRFEEREEGLGFSCDLPECREDVAEALRRGDLDGSVSVGFIVSEGGDTWTHSRGAPSIRTVRSARLVELSLVCAGAYGSLARGVLK